MNIGLDLDNTIVRYDGCFHSLAQSEYLMPASIPAAKSAVRRFFRDSGRENEWTVLQGVAYGRGMVNAVPFAGALDFIRNAFSQGVGVSIISHRTKHPIAGDKNAVCSWMICRKFSTRSFFPTHARGGFLIRRVQIPTGRG